VTTVAQAAWMAGVIDLKGRIQIKRGGASRSTVQHTLGVQHKELAVIRALCVLTGSNAEARREKPLGDIARRGCTEHCPDAHVHVGDEWNMPFTMKWTVSGAALVIVYHNLQPYLQVDRGYDSIVTDIVKAPATTGQGSARTMDRVAELANLGWEIPEPYATALANRKVLPTLEITAA